MKFETKQKVKDIAIRAAKTFIQAFCASITIDAATLSGDTSLLRPMLISAVAAGISAVMNAFVAALTK